MAWIIYQAVSKTTGKKYIGCTKNGLKKRSQFHKSDAKRAKTKFWNAIREHGFDDFEWKELSTCATKEAAEIEEKYYIKSFNTFYDGYNDTFGGTGFSGDLNSKSKISNTLKNKYHKTEGVRLKHSRERGGKDIYVWKVNGTFIGMFSTQIECCEKLNLLKSQVNRILKNKRCTHRGYVFSYENIFPEKLKINSKEERSKGLKVYIKNTGEFVGRFKSILEASVKLGVDRTKIYTYFKNRRPDLFTHPYHFEYVKG